MGYSFAAGTTDGPGALSFEQGTTTSNPMWNFVRNFVARPTEDDIVCHGAKPILLATGRVSFQNLTTSLHIVRAIEWKKFESFIQRTFNFLHPLVFLSFSKFTGWGSKFGTTECRMTNISEFQNCEYQNNERWVFR